MIIISGNTFDVSALMNEYPPDSIERQLLKIMSESAGEYRYDSADELRFELMFRKAVVSSAVRLYRGGIGFSTFHKSKSNEEYWYRMDDGGFKLKEGAAPAEAISDIYRNGRMYATECATAMVIVFYGAALDVFGADAFNRLFPQIILMNWHGIDPLLQGVGVPRNVDDILYGDRAYFKNPDVDPSYPEWRGENVIVMPDGLYYGHGIGIAPAEVIIEALNRRRKEGATQTAYFMDVAARPNYKKLYDKYEQPAERPAAQSAGQPATQSAHLVWGPFPPPVARRIF